MIFRSSFSAFRVALQRYTVAGKLDLPDFRIQSALIHKRIEKSIGQ
jgi:hypothetical protein